jgi:hypothetical protein
VTNQILTICDVAQINLVRVTDASEGLLPPSSGLKYPRIPICYVCSRVVVKELCYKPHDRGFETRQREYFSIYLILSAALGPGVYSASNRNEYQRQTIFLGSRERPVRMADSLTAICEPIV